MNGPWKDNTERTHAMEKEKPLAGYLPGWMSVVRAIITSIPQVGGALDHLLFDGADAMRLKNLQRMLAALQQRLEDIESSAIDPTWFESEVAVATFRLIADRVSFEADKRKIEDLGRVFAACGLQVQSGNARKCSIVHHLSRLSSVQVRLLRVIGGLPATKRVIEGGSLNQTVTAIWVSEIGAELKKGCSFWDGALQLALELEVMESLTVIRRIPLLAASENAYVVTALGQVAAKMVTDAELE